MDEIQKVEDLLNKIKKNKNLELQCALELIYRCGLKKKEVCSITIGDIKEKNNSYFIDTYTKKKKRVIKIDDMACVIFKIYLKSIKQSSETNDDSPLFPNYYKSKGEKNMTRHCQNHSKGITPTTIRSAGVKSYTESLSKAIMDKTVIYKMVSDKFRMTPKSAKDRINGTIKPAGEKKLSNKQEKDLEIIRFFDKLGVLHSPSEISNLTKDFNDKIKQYDFQEEDKNNLIRMWKDKVLILP